jgi:hypothetical protein
MHPHVLTCIAYRVSCITYHVSHIAYRLSTQATDALTLRPSNTLTLHTLHTHTLRTPSQVEKALSCVNAIAGPGNDNSSYLDKVQPCIQYAKVHIFVHDKDRDAAERALWELLKLPKTQFETAISAVKMFIDR